jgi:23S rRNA (guanine745-N1)-methyltransferase
MPAGILRCPHCRAALYRLARVYRCANGHAFDIARQGYVNLLSPSRRHSKDPGDNRDMMLARRRVLESGLYAPIAARINGAVLAALPTDRPLDAVSILDAGAGEGYYLAHLLEALAGPEPGTGPQCYGVDVSRHGMQYATHRSKAVTWVVASVVDLPVISASLDVLLSIFAPLAPPEFQRVLRPDGTLIIAAPGALHLRALREILYPAVRPHQQDAVARDITSSFTVLAEVAVTYEVDLVTPALVADLLTMTPFGWNIDPARRLRAEQAAPLRTALDVVIRTCRPAPGP